MKIPFSIWRNAWYFFEENFVHKQIVYEYRCGNKIKLLEISFKKQHFAHLCGITYKKGPKKFVDDLINRRLKQGDILFSENKYRIEHKAACLNSIHLLLTKEVRVVEGGSFANLQFDSGVRTRRDIFVLTCIYQENGYSVPNSLINLRVGKSQAGAFKNSHPVISIYSIDKKTRTKKVIQQSI